MAFKYSYAEAYTKFLVYCVKKENKSIESLVADYKGNGIEERFRNLYKQQPNLEDYRYYNILRSK